MQHTSSRGQAFIQKQEWVPRSPICGWSAEKRRYFPYKDYKGFPTQACGHLIQLHEDFSAGQTEEEAADMFARDLRKYEAAVTDTFGEIPQHHFDAWVDFAFNEGVGRLAPVQNTAARLYIVGDLEGCARALLMWDVTAGVHDKGLRARRAAEGYVIQHPYETQDDPETYFAPIAGHMSISLEEALARGVAPMRELTGELLEEERRLGRTDSSNCRPGD